MIIALRAISRCRRNLYHVCMRLLTLQILFILSSCQGTRFYWETRYETTRLSNDQITLNQKFKLTKEMSAWHPVFGKYCSSLESDKANLFVCFKGNEVRIISSYSGILKGDLPVRRNPDTIRKYLTMIKDRPGFREHFEIEKYIEAQFEVTKKDVRLLMYGPGSSILKEELSQ